MKYEISNHAAKRMQQRMIETRWVEATLADPDHQEPDAIDPTARHAFKRIVEADDRVLR